MMTAVAEGVPQPTGSALPPHVLMVGRKNALDYMPPALFRLGAFGELFIRAKGSFSIVTAVDVAQLVKGDVAGIETKSISIGTEEVTVEGRPRRVSYIEITLPRTFRRPRCLRCLRFQSAWRHQRRNRQ
jgi:DNA-binding protein Alba